jgi:DNA-binding GntR family transcriptional regulator
MAIRKTDPVAKAKAKAQAEALIESPDDQMARLAGELESDIVCGRLHPRERLTEDDLMKRFSVKRHSVRELLAKLEQMGLVERRKNVGAVVRDYSIRQVQELYAMRSLLEMQAAKLIPLPLPERQLQTLIAIQDKHDLAVQAHDTQGVFSANMAFHIALFALADNEVLQQAITEYARQSHPIRFSSLTSADCREQSRTEHWRIIEALKSGDRESLVQTCGAHLLPSRDVYLKAQQLRQAGLNPNSTASAH